MKHIVDFHIHSKYSRACSKSLNIHDIAKACEKKGVTIVGTGDYTHPKWLQECKRDLKESGDGMYKVIDDSSTTQFILSTEISCIYKQSGATRRIHLLILAPNFFVIEKLIHVLENRGCNLHSDGRPIIGLSAKELLKIILDISSDFEMIPAHAWTPWFSVFGSKSGFNSLEECFEELTPYIHAIETGLSSDPLMNSKLSQLDNIILVSNSDAHGLENLGREANVINLEAVSYKEIISILREKNRNKFLETIEFYPEEGKYHIDGHLTCNFSCNPRETKKLGGVCPKCKKKLTVGVLHRVEDLADRENSEKSKHIPFRYIVPLKEVISAVLQKGKISKTVESQYNILIDKLCSEFHILLDESFENIANISSPLIAEGIMRVREGRVYIEPGYDGKYGIVSVVKPGEKLGARQMSLL